MNIATLDLIIIAVYLVGITATATGSAMFASITSPRSTSSALRRLAQALASFCLHALALFVLLCVLYFSLL